MENFFSFTMIYKEEKLRKTDTLLKIVCNYMQEIHLQAFARYHIQLVPQELGTNDMPRIVPSTQGCVPLLEVFEVYIAAKDSPLNKVAFCYSRLLSQIL